MNSTKTSALQYSLLRDIGILVKFKLSLMVVFSSALSYLILAGGSFSFFEFGSLMAGGLLITFAANAMNQCLEREYDKLMKRTSARPVATGRMSLSFAVLLAGVLCTIGVFILSMVSFQAAMLGMLSFVLYAFVYTPLKRYSPVAIPIGAIPGALPTLIAGVVACKGFTEQAISLFALQYLWQFPHFWSIAWLGHDDYRKAGFKLIRDVEGRPDPKYGLYSAIYAGLAYFIIAFMQSVNVMHDGILIAVISLISIYVWFGINLYRKNNSEAARQLMFVSFFYLPLLFMLFFLNNNLV